MRTTVTLIVNVSRRKITKLGVLSGNPYSTVFAMCHFCTNCMRMLFRENDNVVYLTVSV